MTNYLAAALFCLGSTALSAQPAHYWQQEARYEMRIDVDAERNQFKGEQRLRYINHSPDTLGQVFYHLYFNAFQPGSMMDVRNMSLPDADPRVGKRISRLKPDEIGYQRVLRLSHNGQALSFREENTILEVQLLQPILPGDTAYFDMAFEAQVPLQIRRSGRDNSEGIRFSMAQWYPKLCEYDEQGWHANPYVGREFYGIWGDFDVRIRIAADYVIGGTGYLQNAGAIGYGYAPEGQYERQPDAEGKLEWHFVAENVHDFVWAADPDYTHTTAQTSEGITLHFFYQKGERTSNWEELPAIMVRAMDYANRRFGPYPYRSYAFIQAGDGGMEYPMATLITGHRGLRSLVGVSVHEMMHAWFQGTLATNEALYAWMDEGFTSYATDEIMQYLFAPDSQDDPHRDSYAGYFQLVQSGKEEALSTHADHFSTNFAYGIASYSKGAVFLHQLEYIVGKAAHAEGLRRYYREWGFRHPDVNDFIRVMEKTSGMELDWYKEYMVNGTHYVDYDIEGLESVEGGTAVVLKRLGKFPMPIDLIVTDKQGQQRAFSIPLTMMRGEKRQDGAQSYEVLPDWPWTHDTYRFTLDMDAKDISRIEIDPTHRLADINPDDNSYSQE